MVSLKKALFLGGGGLGGGGTLGSHEKYSSYDDVS